MLENNAALVAINPAAPRAVRVSRPRFSKSRFQARSTQVVSGGGVVSLTIAATAVLLVTGFGDGIAFGLAERLGAASPWLFLFPPLLGALLFCWFCNSRPSRGHLIECYLMLVFMFFVLTLQTFVFAELHMFGLLQLTMFLVFLILIQGVFANSPSWLTEAFPRSLKAAHYFLCGYVVLAFLAWQVLGLEISLVRLINPLDPAETAFTAFRPMGFSKEPQWAAFALGASYMGVFLLIPAERLRALLAMTATAAMLQSGTLLLFSALFGAAFLWQGAGSLRQTASIILVALTLVAQLALFSDRTSQVLSVSDASLVQRVTSGSVAWNVVEGSFPLGVGYGNFREVAEYGAPQWNRFLDLNRAGFYKSDFVLLNFMAELGVFALLILAWVFFLLARSGNALPVGFYCLTLVLSGTLLLPSLLVVAALTGVLIRQKAAVSEARAPIKSSPG